MLKLAPEGIWAASSHFGETTTLVLASAYFRTIDVISINSLEQIPHLVYTKARGDPPHEGYLPGQVLHRPESVNESAALLT
jgi:hypothetical protein